MANKSIKDSTDEVIQLTGEGMSLLEEAYRLHQLAKMLPKIEAYAQIIEELIEKEKKATELIAKSTLIQREIITNLRQEIATLINDL